MSLFTKYRDTIEAFASPIFQSDSSRKQKTGVTGLINRGESALGGAVNRALGRPGAEEKRNQTAMVQQQIDLYRQQNKLSIDQLAATQAEQASEKRRINEKQIRALRNNYRPAGGFLGVSNSPSSPTSVGSLPNKLGAA